MPENAAKDTTPTTDPEKAAATDSDSKEEFE